MPMKKNTLLGKDYFFTILLFNYFLVVKGGTKAIFEKKLCHITHRLCHITHFYCRLRSIRVSEEAKNKKVWHITHFFCGKQKTGGFVSIFLSDYPLFACCVHEINSNTY